MFVPAYCLVVWRACLTRLSSSNRAEIETHYVFPETIHYFISNPHLIFFILCTNICGVFVVLALSLQVQCTIGFREQIALPLKLIATYK